MTALALLRANWKLIGIIALAVIATVGIGIGYCSLQRTATGQAKQTTRSSEAIADAAEQAVATVINTNEREASVDAVVAQAAKEIDNAPDPATARAAAFRAVCGLPEYSRDPACAVQ